MDEQPVPVTPPQYRERSRSGAIDSHPLYLWRRAADQPGYLLCILRFFRRHDNRRETAERRGVGAAAAFGFSCIKGIGVSPYQRLNDRMTRFPRLDKHPSRLFAPARAS